MSVRAKFRVNSVLETTSVGKDGNPLVNVLMTAVYDPDPEGENHKYWDATPAGNISLGILNQEASKEFIPGQEYYVDFTHAPKES